LGRRSLRKSGAYTNAERQKRWRARRRAERRRAAAEAKQIRTHAPVVVHAGRLVGVLGDLIREGKRFGCLYIDPPWRFVAYGAGNSRKPRYPTLSVEEICRLPVADLAVPNSVLFLWTTSAHLKDAFEVLAAWDFEYVSHFIWVKNRAGLGCWIRTQHEVLLFARRGSPPTPAPSARPPSVIHAARREHSRKPDEIYGVIERMYPTLPRIELFARSRRDGWTAWGNQIHPK
jgi:N6-adenosine-specific RNA methylase IME4